MVVEIDDSYVMAMSATAYLIPLAGFGLGLGGGWLLSHALTGLNAELLMALCAVAGTFLAYLVMRALDPHFAKGRWEPRIVSVTRPAAKEEA